MDRLLLFRAAIVGALGFLTRDTLTRNLWRNTDLKSLKPSMTRGSEP